LTLADERFLSNPDSGEESGDETLVDDSETLPHYASEKTERIILRNVALHQALQINAALGKDIWKDTNRIVTKDNRAEDQSVQLNYGTSLEAFTLAMKMQGMKLKEMGIAAA